MTLTVQITPEVERQLVPAAQAAGLSPDTYVAQLIQADLNVAQSPRHNNNRLSSRESALIQTINRSLSGIDWQHYQRLIKKRQNETLTAEEQVTLIAFSDQVEQANVGRLEAIADLAELHNTSMDAIMNELELKPQPYV